MIRLFKYTTAKLWLLLLLLIILSGIAVSIGRFLVPLAELYRSDVEQWASNALGQPVEVGFLEGHWRGLGPELTLHNVALLDSNTRKPTLKLDEIKLRLALVESVKNRAITLRKITLVNPKLLIKRRSDGSIVIEGLQEIGQQQISAGGALLFPSRVALRHGEIFWENQAIGAPPIRFTNVNMELRNDGDRHQFTGSLNLPGELGAEITLAADITGELEQPEAWSGEAYLRGYKLVLTQLLKHQLPEGYLFDSGQAGMEVWISWEKGRMHGLQGNLQLHETRLALRSNQAPGTQKALDIDLLGGDFLWQRKPRGWQFIVDNIQFQHQNGSWPDTRFHVETGRGEDGRLRVYAGTDFLRIEDLVSLASLFPLPDPALKKTLATIAPHGDISELNISYQETSNGPQWRGVGTLQGLSTQPWNDIPGVENLTARIWTDSEKGVARLLSSGSVALEFPKLFRNPLEIDRLLGTIEWESLENGHWNIESNNLSAANADIQTRTRFHIDIPLQDPASAFLDLQTDFKNGDGSQVSRYLPTGIMPEGTVAWLDRGIVDGHITSGSALFRGKLQDFPFEENPSGRFEVLFNVDDAHISYWPEWPDLRAVDAEVRFLNNRFDAWAIKGNIYDSRIEQVHAAIPGLGDAAPLEIDGRVLAPLADTFRFLKESPLIKRFAPMTRGIDAGGESILALDLTVPLRSRDSYELDGKLEFDNSSLHLKEWQLPLTGIKGTLGFNLDGVQAKGINGQLFGNPISVDVTPSPEFDATRIRATTPLSKQDLEKHFSQMNLAHLDGSGDITLQLDLPSVSHWKKATIPIEITSRLKGFSIDLPAPLGKEEEEERTLYISTQLGSAKQSPFQIDYADLLSAALKLDTSTPKTGLLGGSVVLGKGKATLPEHNTLTFKGGWEHVDLSPWLALLPEEKTGTPEPRIGDIDLKFDQLALDDLELNDFQLQLNRQDGIFTGQIASDLLSGKLQIPADLESQAIQLRLNHLDFKLEPDNWSSDTPSTDSPIDPTTIPALDASIDKVSINGKDYGKLTLQTSRRTEGLGLEQFTLQSEMTSIQASGAWRKESDGVQATQLDLSLESDDFGKLLDDLGFTANLTEAPSTIKADISWQGNPMQFSRHFLNGNLNMQLGSGRFLQVNPGVGRIFGLLNISALHRRLTLDFSDMLKEGFTFDRIEGYFLVEDGDAYTENFLMKGPSATIDIAGRIGLSTEDFDQLITVTPMISSSLPLAGAWAVGPAVGAALLLAHKLFGDKFDKATQVQYQVTGPWSDPVLTTLKSETPISESQMIDPDLVPPQTE
ncbi:YhdP family protein [Solemya velesiana gill symbiont]|uniref:TIGR02099 family protein n=1 Tax=Solemya velesiana gill symbiont TaxID=1918948 RepID=A0A1T2KU64_9GAMM|nr:YhdP family protein [Solemya velesiana gill symbiont]OOZ36399.1 TIGR02099 family protein [Solemya velesiana gill symbiont]